MFCEEKGCFWANLIMSKLRAHIKVLKYYFDSKFALDFLKKEKHEEIFFGKFEGNFESFPVNSKSDLDLIETSSKFSR